MIREKRFACRIRMREQQEGAEGKEQREKECASELKTSVNETWKGKLDEEQARVGKFRRSNEVILVPPPPTTTAVLLYPDCVPSAHTYMRHMRTGAGRASGVGGGGSSSSGPASQAVRCEQRRREKRELELL